MEKNIIQELIDAGVCTHKDVEQYLHEYRNQKRLIKQKVEKIQPNTNETEIYSKIEKGILLKVDERDIDKKGNYTVPANVYRIAEYAFSACKNVTTITLGTNVRTIDSHAFFNCGVRYLNLGSVESINSWAFDFCMNLTEIKLSKELKYVGDSAFYNCVNLKRFITPTEVINLKGCKFAGRTDAQEEIQSYIYKNKMLTR